MATVNTKSTRATITAKRPGRPPRPPNARNCAIYERVRLESESREKVAAEHALSRQRIAQVVAQVEGWIASHPTHELAQKMRVRCGKRWETLWSRSIDSFDRSRQNREVKKERTARRAANGAAAEMLTTVTEQTVREQNGDPRFLNIALRVADREDRLWLSLFAAA